MLSFFIISFHHSKENRNRNMRFTPSSLALALSSTSVALSNSVDANGAGTLLANRYGKKTSNQRRAEQMFPIDASDVVGAVAVVSSEFDAADSGILRRRRLNGNSLLFGGGASGLASFRRSLQNEEEEDADYYYNLYCPFAKCVVDGGTNEECGCKFYNQACELYDSRKYKVS